MDAHNSSFSQFFGPHLAALWENHSACHFEDFLDVWSAVQRANLLHLECCVEDLALCEAWDVPEPEGGDWGVGAFQHMDRQLFDEPCRDLPSFVQRHLSGLPWCQDPESRIAESSSASCTYEEGMFASAHHEQVLCSAPLSFFNQVSPPGSLPGGFSFEQCCGSQQADSQEARAVVPMPPKTPSCLPCQAVPRASALRSKEPVRGKRVRFHFAVQFWFPEPSQLCLPCVRTAASPVDGSGDAPPVSGSDPPSHTARETLRVLGPSLARGEARGRGVAVGGEALQSAAATSATSGDMQSRFTSFDLLSGADVLVRPPSGDADACVRRAITRSQVPAPIGRLVRSNVPNWPTPQAIVSLGSHFYTHIPCVLLLRGERHVPIVIEALPWETPAHLIRFAPLHLGLVGAVSCFVNGFEAHCDCRLPPDTDWVELVTEALTAEEARKCAAAFARLPADDAFRVPPSWTQAGYFPYHGFPAQVFAQAIGPFGCDPVDPDASSSSGSEDYFSSSHSGSPDCARASRPPRPRHSSGDSRPGVTARVASHRIEPKASSSSISSAGPGCRAPPSVPAPQRRWGRGSWIREFAEIAQDSLAEDVEMTVFDTVLHVRVILCSVAELEADPVGLALDRSPHLPPGFHGRVLRYQLEGFPASQVVLFDPARPDLRTAPVELKGDLDRVCTVAFHSDASPFELALLLARDCAAPSTLRFQVARKHARVEANGVGVSSFEARALIDADAVEIYNVRQYWTPRSRPDVQELLDTQRSFTPEILLPLQVRRSFTGPVSSVVVHRPGRPAISVGFDPWMRPAALRARVLESVDYSSAGLMKLPLLSPHFDGSYPHALVFEQGEFRRGAHWALFDVRRIEGHAGTPFFVAPLPDRVNVGYVMRVVHERLSGTGPIAGVFCDNLLMSDDWTPLPDVCLLTLLAPGADLLDRPPAVLFTMDPLESNVGYQSSHARWEERASASSSRRQVGGHSSTATTTEARVLDSGRMAINPDPVHEGPMPRDPRDHLICLVASAQCPPGAFTFHRSIDVPELPTRALYYVAQHAFLPCLPVVAFSPVVYLTLARIRMLYATVREEHEPRVYVWIDVLPQARYPVFRPVDGPASLEFLIGAAGVSMPVPAVATVNGQAWSGAARHFTFGDVVQVRQCREALLTLSLDSFRFTVSHIELLFKPVFGPEMRFDSRNVQARPAIVYRPFTRQRLYDHFKRIFTARARELILVPGSSVMFVGPDLPPIRVSSGGEGEPTGVVAQALFDSLFRGVVGDRRVRALGMQLSEAWLFAALPSVVPSVAWAYESHFGVDVVHSDRAGVQLLRHPLMERSCLLPSITFGDVGIAIHTFDNRARPVLQRRVLGGLEEARLPLQEEVEGLSLLQMAINVAQPQVPKGVSEATASGRAFLRSIATPCRRRQCAEPLATPSIAQAPPLGGLEDRQVDSRHVTLDVSSVPLVSAGHCDAAVSEWRGPAQNCPAFCVSLYAAIHCSSAHHADLIALGQAATVLASVLQGVPSFALYGDISLLECPLWVKRAAWQAWGPLPDLRALPSGAELHCYTDGSFVAGSAAWAIVVFAWVPNDGWHFQGVAAASTRASAFQENVHDALDGEAAALSAALS